MRLQKSITIAAIIAASLFSVANAQEARNPVAPMTNYIGSNLPQAAGAQSNYLAQMIPLQPLLSAAPQPNLSEVLGALGLIEAPQAAPMAAPATEEGGNGGRLRDIVSNIFNR